MCNLGADVLAQTILIIILDNHSSKIIEMRFDLLIVYKFFFGKVNVSVLGF